MKPREISRLDIALAPKVNSTEFCAILPGTLRMKKPKVRQSRTNKLLCRLGMDTPRYQVTYRFEYGGES